MKIKFEWEQFFSRVTDQLRIVTVRAKVIGGWIVLNKSTGALRSEEIVNISTNASESMVFIVDPEHRWDPITLEERKIEKYFNRFFSFNRKSC